MAIVPMKHLRLIAVSEEQDALLDELHSGACLPAKRTVGAEQV